MNNDAVELRNSPHPGGQLPWKDALGNYMKYFSNN